MAKIRFKFKILSRIIIVFSCFALVLFPIATTDLTVFASTTDELNSKLTDLSKQLDDIKKKKKDIENRINQEAANQNSLASQISLYDSKIQSIQLNIDEKKKTIESLETQIALTEAQMKEKEAKIADLTAKINELNDIYAVRVASNFENSFKGPIDGILEGESFETFMVQKEFANSLAKENQDLADSLAANKADLDDQKQKLAADLKQQQDLQDQVKAETTDLGNQQVGLSSQKTQKAALLDQSKNNSQTLQQQKSELQKIADQKQREMDAYLLQIISVRGNGATVHKGDAIGRMGRSGYVLNCNGNSCYYPDPDKEPCGGAHLHFEVAKKYTDGKYYRTNPLPYLQNGVLGAPLRSYWFTQYYQGNDGSYSPFAGFDRNGNFSSSVSGHSGIDIVGDSNCGTTLYAGADGVISYYCRPFQWPGYRSDPTFFAVLYDPVHDVNITYMHLQKAPGAC